MNPYLAPKSVDAARQSVPRFQLIATLLAVFVGYMGTVELAPQLVSAARLGRVQNPIGLVLGTTIFALVAYATFAEWRGRVALLRNTTLVCAVLVPITAFVTARFVLYFVPVLSADTLSKYRDVIFGEAFCVVVWLYFAKVLSRHRVIRQHIEGDQAMNAESRS